MSFISVPPAANDPVLSNPTWIGLAAIPLWALTPVFIVLLGAQAAFGLLAVRFLISGGVLSAIALIQGQSLWRQFYQPWGLWALSLGGILFSQWIYILALQHAPAAEANFINYLWPMYLMIFSALLGGEKVPGTKIFAILIAFAGAAVIMLGERGLQLSPEYNFGYALALLAGFSWAVYSLCLRRFYQHRGNTILGGPFLLYAAICYTAHILLGEPELHFTAEQWVYAVAFGLVPMGYVFWEHGMRHGQVPYLALGAYFIPLLSAIALNLLAGHDWTWSLMLGGAMIVLAPVLAHIAAQKSPNH